MGLSKIIYRAVRAKTSTDRKEIRIVRDVGGPHAELRPEPPQHVATLTDIQARSLRDSLTEVLGVEEYPRR